MQTGGTDAMTPPGTACAGCGVSVGEGMNYCPAGGAPLVPVSVSEAAEPSTSAGGGIHSFFLLLVAAAIPLGVVLLIVAVQPSVLKQPELYFAYALIEATLFLLLFRMFDLYERELLSVLA